MSQQNSKNPVTCRRAGAAKMEDGDALSVGRVGAGKMEDGGGHAAPARPEC